MARGTRPRRHRLEVWCTEQEYSQIKVMAHQTRMSTSSFLRALGTGYQPRSSFDSEAVEKLVRLHAEQGRMGGLLKLWLSEKRDFGAPAFQVRALMRQVEELKELVAQVVTHEAHRL